MELYIRKTILSVIKGEDYRPHVLATINSRFLEKANLLIKDIFDHKRKGDDWLSSLLSDVSQRSGKEAKFELLWLTGLNDKTVKNMSGGSSTKEVIIDLGKKNLDSIRKIMDDSDLFGDGYDIVIKIQKDGQEVLLDSIESVIVMNIISTMKLTVQGGAWSEVGKQTEKGLLYAIFTLLNVPDDDYVLFPELINDREIDGIVFTKHKDNPPITIEIKLLGIGNPEIGDEAQARKVNLFLVDRMSDMMIEVANRLNVRTIEFRNQSGKKALDEIYEFLTENEVSCQPPPDLTWPDLEKQINSILDHWNIEAEKLRMQRTIKKLSKNHD